MENGKWKIVMSGEWRVTSEEEELTQSSLRTPRTLRERKI
jgi:hypothetical protein